MQLARFCTMAENYLEDFELDDWSFSFNHHMTNFGMCYFATKTIVASAPLVELNSVAAGRDTILHEIAHALAGWRAAHHGPKWQRIAANIGADPTATYDEAGYNMPYKYDVTCPSCQTSWRYKRKTKAVPCGCDVPAIWKPTVYHLTAFKC